MICKQALILLLVVLLSNKVFASDTQILDNIMLDKIGSCQSGSRKVLYPGVAYCKIISSIPNPDDPIDLLPVRFHTVVIRRRSELDLKLMAADSQETLGSFKLNSVRHLADTHEPKAIAAINGYNYRNANYELNNRLEDVLDNAQCNVPGAPNSDYNQDANFTAGMLVMNGLLKRNSGSDDQAMLGVGKNTNKYIKIKLFETAEFDNSFEQEFGIAIENAVPHFTGKVDGSKDEFARIQAAENNSQLWWTFGSQDPLIVNGSTKLPRQPDQADALSAIGFNDDYIMMITTDFFENLPNSYDPIITEFINFGITDAVALDGGSAAAMVINSDYEQGLSSSTINGSENSICLDEDGRRSLFAIGVVPAQAATESNDLETVPEDENIPQEFIDNNSDLPSTGIIPFLRKPFDIDKITGVNSYFDHNAPNYTSNGELVNFNGITQVDKAGTLCTLGINCYDGHDAIDYDTPNEDNNGTAVLNAAYGTVIEVVHGGIVNNTGIGCDKDCTENSEECGNSIQKKLNNSLGNYVVIQHSVNEHIFQTTYAHLRDEREHEGQGVQAKCGATMNAGDLIGIAGKTGTAGDHLHFAVKHKVGAAFYKVDPFGWWGDAEDPWGQESYQLWLSSNSVDNRDNGFQDFDTPSNRWLSVNNDTALNAEASKVKTIHNTVNYWNASSFWVAQLSEKGMYKVQAHIPKLDDSAANDFSSSAEYRIMSIDTHELNRNRKRLVTVKTLNHQELSKNDSNDRWFDLAGDYYCDKLSSCAVILTNHTSDEDDGSKYIWADAIRWVPVTIGRSFIDVKSEDWFYRYVSKLSQEGIVTGYDEEPLLKSFKPRGFVTRAEFLKMVLTALEVELPEVTAKPFPDVETNAWYAQYVQYAKDHGIAQGLENGNFAPNNNITRAEALKILFKAQNKNEEDHSGDISFSDVNESDWHYDFVQSSQEANIARGYNNDANCRSNENEIIQGDFFCPNHALNRAEASKIVIESIMEGAN